jgi:hypothetical protein
MEECIFSLMVVVCWVCVIFFARVVVSECLRRACRGLGAAPPKIFFWADIFSPVSGRHIIAGPTYFRDHMILGGFRHMVFCRWFSISG